ncbi:MAG TPA: crosslink repair DNA glycosylase YcaQ family protein [Anaerolineaceae bacterium]
MSISPLTKAQVRTIQLAAQGLLKPPEQPASKSDVLFAIRKMHALQIDTINVVARSPYLVLWSRLGDYQPKWLEELHAEGHLFEYWSHAACFLPIEDFPLYRRWMLDGTRGWIDSAPWIRKHQVAVDAVIHRIQEEGPLRSADFVNHQKPAGGWWNWKEEKIALDRLHSAGELMIRRRVNFQRVYDLTHRVLPDWDDHNAPPAEDVYTAFTMKTFEALGIATAKHVPDYFRLRKTPMAKTIKHLLDTGKLMHVEVEGWTQPAYIPEKYTSLVEQVLSGEITSELTTILSPFDPLIWDRARTKEIFGFDFALECYLPQGKRKWGYFLLPILHRGKLIGRLDAKAHRQKKIMQIKALYLEPEIEVNDLMIVDLKNTIQSFADWHKTPQVVIERIEPAILAHHFQ